MASRPFSLDSWATLGLLCEGERHGWALVRALSPDGEVGRVWSVSRALVYRTIDGLLEAGLASRLGVERGARGSPRTLLQASDPGRVEFSAWLREPVAHVRDLRSALLLKLLFAERSGVECAPLLADQAALLTETVEALQPPSAGAHSFEDTLLAFRLETARAGLRFVEGELARTRT